MKNLAAGALLLAGIGAAAYAAYGFRAQKPKPQVFLFLSTDCPIAQSYTPRIQKILADYGGEFSFAAEFPNDLETDDAIKKYMDERKYAFPWQRDVGAERANMMGVKRVPEVVVIHPMGRILYKGAIDDNKDSTLVKNHWLRDALTAIAKGEQPKVRSTEAFGCLLMPGETVPTKDKVNYAEHVAPIINRSCVTCHRPGEVAPFSLSSYELAKKWAPMIAEATSGRRMPPWKATHGFVELSDDPSLSQRDIETLKVWNEAGAPAGDLKRAPKPPAFSSEWSQGKPDLVLTPKRPFTLAAEGSDEYRHFVLDPGAKETLWVRGMDVKPGNNSVVHHVIAFIDTSGGADRKNAASSDGQEGYDSFGSPGFLPFGALGGWAPGLRTRLTNGDLAFEVPPGAKIVMQVHYHRNGKQETDQTRLGLYLSKTPPKKTMRLAWLLNPAFRIPAGADSHKVNLNFRVPKDITLYGAMPHMHLLGKTMKAEVEFPDGSRKPLISVDDWDFRWQLQYTLKEPMKVPAGSRIVVEGTYDNSVNNPNNPNSPPKPVTWGEQTTDEMFLLIAPYTLDDEVVAPGKPRSRGIGIIG